MTHIYEVNFVAFFLGGTDPVLSQFFILKINISSYEKFAYTQGVSVRILYTRVSRDMVTLIFLMFQ
jgi:hypothetical protein